MLVLSLVKVRAKMFFWLLISLALGLVLAACRLPPTPASPTPLPTAEFTVTSATSSATLTPGFSTSLPSASLSEATLLVYSSVERLLAGDLLHTITVDEVQTHLAGYPPDWPVVGVGTTNWIGRNGEMMPDGTAGGLHFWWADPGSPSHASVIDLMDNKPPAQFPFLGLAVGDPATAITWTLRGVPDVHAWLEEKLDASGIDLAGVQLRGQFGPVKTTVAYNIPLTGLDLSGGYMGEDYFRFGEYVTATWTMNGLYATDPAVEPVISTPGHPLHLHGYQPETMLGGHVGSASAISVTTTIWPLTGVQAWNGDLDSLRQPQSNDEAGIATSDGVYYAPTWDQVELAKFLTYEELASAPTVHNPDGDATLTLYIPEWEASLPIQSWTVRDVQHQIATVQSDDKQASATREALAEGRPLVAINQSGLRHVTDPVVGDLVLGSPLDNRLGAVLILSLTRRYAGLDPAERPDLYIVGRPREEHPDPSAFLFILPISDADLVIVVDDPAPVWYPTLGGGPVVVWHPERTPEWGMEALSSTPRPEGWRGRDEGQIFEAEDPAFLTIVADDARPDVPALLVGPAMLRYHSSEEKMSVADIERCERLLMALLDRIAEQPANPLTLMLDPSDVLLSETIPGTVSDGQSFLLDFVAVTNSGPVTITLETLQFDLLRASRRMGQEIYESDALADNLTTDMPVEASLSDDLILAPGETALLAGWLFEPDVRLEVDGLQVTARGYTLDMTPVETHAGVAMAPREEVKSVISHLISPAPETGCFQVEAWLSGFPGDETCAESCRSVILTMDNALDRWSACPNTFRTSLPTLPPVRRWASPLKTYLNNAPADTRLETLVRLSGMRWPIETCF